MNSVLSIYILTLVCNDIKRDVESNNDKINDIERKISSMETDVYNYGVDIRSIKENLGY